MFYLPTRRTHSLTDNRDVIFPGEMKDLMNKVTEAKKSAEANAISRRETTASIDQHRRHAVQVRLTTARLYD